MSEDNNNEEEKQEEEEKDEEEQEEEESEEDEDEEVEVPEKFEDIVEEIEEMSVLELSELVGVLEDKFGVSAAAPAAAAPAAAGAATGGSEGEEEEQTEFDVVLKDFGDAKIQVIKAIKKELEIGLADAKGMVDEVPSTIEENLDKEAAEELKEALEEAGGTVELE